ncbi:C2H2 finger domain protein, putative [Talaromyces stipitatus ATCC 10500]|uniref:C2H2 finger domain protein, putative n=1 Tax=Talaromyces stipitatus (strain ATCC 10500 / CBS 375.48 / QM 6759 / NRRL 1006) TaxID=441959 RepID=B8MNW1_TALSN|nr:C2H2 finger domain protein, putative [Talaromyces stipitatus ATCC 10500]EED14200.1 C2H2 finger domain protein, putative [Talaromyces stipitatus ATCC 10500]
MMAPRGFTNPAPKTDSARSALNSFTCTLCNKSYSRHPEYEAHIGSYDHQHRKRLQDLKQLSRDPNAAERARRAERKADAEAGLLRVDNNDISSSVAATTTTTTAAGGSGGGGFKKGGFKSSFTTVKGPATSAASTTAPVRKNVLGGDDDDDVDMNGTNMPRPSSTATTDSKRLDAGVESDTDEEYQTGDAETAYYDPLKPTGCFDGCTGLKTVSV